MTSTGRAGTTTPRGSSSGSPSRGTSPSSSLSPDTTSSTSGARSWRRELAVAHLRRRDATLRRVIDAVGPLELGTWTRGRPRDPYGSLLRSIVGQQLSVAAARSIFARLVAANGGTSPTPDELLRLGPARLRACGLSRAKVAYVRDLARHVRRGDLDLSRLRRLEDDEVRGAITAVKGVGRWTADMFLLFHLRRPDVLPVGDLGLRRAVERAYAVPLPTASQLEELGDAWRPYRSLATLYLWETLTKPSGA